MTSSTAAKKVAKALVKSADSIDCEKITKIIESGQCQRTGLPFVLDDPSGPFYPTLSRNSDEHLVVVAIYNAAKGSWSDADVLSLAAALTGQSSIGDLADRISILEIKQERITDSVKVRNVNKELRVLQHAFRHATSGDVPETVRELIARLKRINEKIWSIEDAIRDCERRQDFGANFVQLARSVYITNDKRAAVKKEINLLLNSGLIEEKSYTDYMTQEQTNDNDLRSSAVEKCNQLLRQRETTYRRRQ